MSTDYGKVIVTDIKIPFGSMLVLMVKWAVATIPALIILSVIGTLTFGIINASSMGGWHIRMKIEPDEPEAQALRNSAKRKIMERKTKTS